MRHSLARGVAALILFCATGASAMQTVGGPPAVATIRGRVSSQDGAGPVVAAQVVLVGTARRTVTDSAGAYAITGVAQGQWQVRVTRIGYQPGLQLVTVPEAGSVVADFVLPAVPTILEEVLSTATGDQSRREFGNVQARLDVDSIMKTAPALTFQDVLQAKAAGVQVFNGTGATGAGQVIRIRGISSISLTNDPLVIVDGARFDAGSVTSAFGVSSTRLGDLNLQDIASVDVVRGPSAAALYGTAAANGVVIVKTKRGQSGGTRWNTFAEFGRVHQPSEFETNWRSWGRNLNAAGAPTGGAVQCTLVRSALSQCLVDSLTSNNPYTNPLTSPFRDANGNPNRTPRSMLGVQAAGGEGVMRYFLSISHEEEVGPFVMPDSEIARITAVRGTAPRETQIRPNQLTHNSYRGNFQLALATNATIDISAGAANRVVYQPLDGSLLGGLTFQLMTAPGCVTKCAAALRTDGQYTNGTQREFVGDIFSVEERTASQRFTGSASLNWSPYEWLQVRSTVGGDQSNTYGNQLGLLGEGPNQASAFGPTAAQGFSGKDAERNNVNRYSVDFGATARRQINDAFISRTTLGAQWFRDESYRSRLQGYGLGPGVTTVNSASQRTASEFTVENATYGAFVEQQLAWRDRLFASAGLRTDQNSAFGRDVGNTLYPRASLSYVISDEPWFPSLEALSSFRLRTAWGRAGVQPGTIAALPFLTATTYAIGGIENPALRFSSIGNAALKPEVTTELEAGVDAGLFDARVNVEATIFRKLSRDALFSRPLPPSFGAGASQFQNLGKVENRGWELSVGASILQSHALSWEVRLNGSHVRNRLVTLGDAVLTQLAGARNAVGYPIHGLWDREILSYEDANADGVLVESEIVVADAQSFRGSSMPQYEAGLSNSIGLFGGMVRLSALLDYRGKYYGYWQAQNQRCVSTGNCRAVNDPTTPLAEQAPAVMGASSTSRTLWGFFAPADFVRFREASASFTVPERLTQRYLRARRLDLVVSGRNLGMLWNKFPGTDPEANVSPGSTTADFTAEPPLRYFIVRFNLSF